MSLQDNISIVAATDNHYAILLAALIKSIEVNHKTSEKIDFYIIDDGVSSTNRKKIEESSNKSVTTLHWFKTNEVIPKGINIPIDKSAFPITTYLRLFAPYIIPKETKRVIYLDVDMIVLEDISKLWHTDIQGHLFGAVRDIAETVDSTWSGIPNYKQLGLDPKTRYFNAGLLVIDPIKWREADVSNKVIENLIINKEYVNLADQYGLNVTLVNQWFELDRRWNCFARLDMKDPYLIHFLDIKPIFKSYNCNVAYKDEFYKYLRLTPWKNHTPVSDFKRLFRKATNKLKKRMKLFFKAK